MLAEREVERVEEEPASVPLYSLEAVGGYALGGEQAEWVEERISWHGARRGDFAVHLVGHSMEPRIPAGSIVLLRPYAPCGIDGIEWGRVHAVILDDGSALLKTVRAAPGSSTSLLLHSENPAFPDAEVPLSRIRRLHLAVAVQHPL